MIVTKNAAMRAADSAPANYNAADRLQLERNQFRLKLVQ
jgi:hypothetical protein